MAAIRSALLAATFALALAPFAAGGGLAAAPAMWTIRDGNSTVTLFGTSHVARPEARWRTPALDSAIKAAGTLWLEIRPDEDRAESGAIIQSLGLDPAHPLASKLSEAQRSKLDAVLLQYGLPAARIAPMKPWLAALTVSMLPLAKAGLSATAGADVVIRDAARQDGDRVDGFETAEQQIRYLADLAEADQIAFLDDVLDRALRGTELPLQVADAWERGDLHGLDRILNRELKRRSPLLYRRLVAERNRRFAERIRELLARDQDQLVAVGVGHLVGRDSIQAILRKQGLRVRRVQ